MNRWIGYVLAMVALAAPCGCAGQAAARSDQPRYLDLPAPTVDAAAFEQELDLLLAAQTDWRQVPQLSVLIDGTLAPLVALSAEGRLDRGEVEQRLDRAAEMYSASPLALETLARLRARLGDSREPRQLAAELDSLVGALRRSRDRALAKQSPTDRLLPR